MRLKDGIVTRKIGPDDEYVAVPTGESAVNFNGIIRNNKTANFIFEQLMNDQTEDSLTDALLAVYDVSEEVARRDIRAIVDKIRDAGLLVE